MSVVLPVLLAQLEPVVPLALLVTMVLRESPVLVVSPVVRELPVCRECPVSVELLVSPVPREREVMVVPREPMVPLAKMAHVV